MTHDFKRNRSSSLFAALNILDRKVISDCMAQHRHQEWLKFLRLIDKSTPRRKQLHLIIDNYSTHNHPDVQAWLKDHKRFHLHFTPTSPSCLNTLQPFLRPLTQKQIGRGCFASLAQLIETIEAYISQHNTDPKPFVWAAKASDILEKVKRARAGGPMMGLGSAHSPLVGMQPAQRSKGDVLQSVPAYVARHMLGQLVIAGSL